MAWPDHGLGQILAEELTVDLVRSCAWDAATGRRRKCGFCWISGAGDVIIVEIRTTSE